MFCFARSLERLSLCFCSATTQNLILEQHAKKRDERTEWWAVVENVLEDKDKKARKMVQDFEKLKKRTFL